MKGKYILLLFVVLSFESLHAQKEELDKHCHYKVGEIVEYLNESIKEVSVTSYPSIIDENGIIVPDFETDFSHYKYTIWFKEGELTGSSDLGRDSGGLYTFVSKINKDGLATEKIYSSSFDTINVILCEYDDVGNCVLEKFLTSDRKTIELYKKYFYDNLGRVVLIKHYKSNGDVAYKRAISYNEKGNVVSKNSYIYEDDNIDILYRETNYYIYDNSGNWIWKYIYMQDKLEWISVRKITYY